MKHALAIALAAILFGIAFNASATGKPVEPSTSQQQNQQQDATGVGIGVGVGGSSSANGIGHAEGGSATGGSSSATATAAPSNSYSALSNDIDYNSKMRHISLAPPVWTVIPQASGCIVSGSTAWSAVLGLASYSGSKQVSDGVCTMVNMASAAQSACQYKTAAIINRRVFETLNPDVSGEFFELNAPANLTPTECAELIRPRLIVDTRMSQPEPRQDVFNNLSVQCAQPAQRPSGVARKSKPAKVCR